MPSETFTHQAVADASIEKAWAALDRPGTWEAIAGIDRVFDPVIDDAGRLRGFSFETFAAGKTYVGVATPHERVEGERIALRVSNSEIRGITSVELAPEGTGTRVTVTLEIQSAGLLSSMFFPVIAGAIGNVLPRAVDDFAYGLED